MNKVHFNQLVDHYLTGELSDADYDELCRTLLASAEARQTFWQMAGTHAALREWGKAHWGRMVAERATGHADRRRLHKRMKTAAAIALLLAVSAALWLVAVQTSNLLPRMANPAAAQITAVNNTRWDGEQHLEQGDVVGSGPLRLLEGSAQMKFASGATVVLNGATDLDIVNENRVFLRSGNITPFVPPEAKGFTVVSPSGEVVDLGTEFSIGVDDTGLTSVYVIDGEVDVASGHARRRPPLRVTQGFEASVSGPSAATPDLTQAPIVIDHFTAERSNAHPVTEAAPMLRWTDLTAGHPARVVDGRLVIPFADDPSWLEPAVSIRLDNDFRPLVGRRSKVTYKVMLPPGGTIGVKRWLALVIDGRPLAARGDDLPLAQSQDCAAAVMVSPVWQAGVRVGGQPLPCGPIFRRDEDASGPYQFVVSIDDSPACRRTNGGARLDVMVNGVAFATNTIITLNENPQLGFVAYVPRGKGWTGEASAWVDDFSASVEVDREEAVNGGPHP